MGERMADRPPVLGRWEVMRAPGSGRWHVYNSQLTFDAAFTTWRDAYEHADRMARTNQGEDK